VYVLTHHPRPWIEMDGATTFHFIDAAPAEALDVAREAAGGLDVRIGGGPSTIRQFLATDLIDYLHVVIVPTVLGRGERLWMGSRSSNSVSMWSPSARLAASPISLSPAARPSAVEMATSISHQPAIVDRREASDLWGRSEITFGDAGAIDPEAGCYRLRPQRRAPTRRITTGWGRFLDSCSR
jgi:hypothetical protein